MAVEAPVKLKVQEFLKGTKKMLIGGKWVESLTGKTFPTYNPATGEVLTRVAEGDKGDIDLAVKAARKAFESGPWPKMTPSERGRLIYKLADMLEAHAEEFAQLETLDNGKPITETTNADVPLTIDHFRYYAGWATKVTGQTIPVSVPGYFNYTRREPVGVIGQIIPWNFPLLMCAWKLGAALATGNTVVLKPAEQTPLTALRLGELMMEAGFPEGVVNIVPGFGETAGASLAEHPDVDKVAFTGSTEVGRKIMQAASVNIKKISLELGGKSPNIILPDADLTQALPGALMGIYFNAGQVCCAGSRLYVDKKAYDNVLSDMASQASSLKQGPGINPETQIGPLVSEEQLKRVSGYIEKGKEEGAKVLTGGAYNTSGGYFVQPTVFADVRDEMTIAKEEIFGPVITAMPFDEDNIDDLVRRANDSIYGLAAAIWTRDVKKAHQIAHALKAGTVWINSYNVFDAASPFGGYKQSGIGREMGSYALELYTEVKSVWVNLN